MFILAGAATQGAYFFDKTVWEENLCTKEAIIATETRFVKVIFCIKLKIQNTESKKSILQQKHPKQFVWDAFCMSGDIQISSLQSRVRMPSYFKFFAGQWLEGYFSNFRT